LRRVKWAAKKHSELFYSALCARIYKKNSTLFFTQLQPAIII